MLKPLTRLLNRLVASRAPCHDSEDPVLVKTIYSSDRLRKVEFERRRDGSFTFEEWEYSTDPLEQCWIPVPRDSWSFCDSLATAEREAHGRISWLANGNPNEDGGEA